MITSKALEQMIKELPEKLLDKREKLRREESPGGAFGVRKAAKIASVCPSTFHRAEKGEIKDLKSLIKLLKFVERSNVGVENKFLKWTNEDIGKLRRMFADKKSDKEIGRALFRTPSSIEHKRVELGLMKFSRK